MQLLSFIIFFSFSYCFSIYCEDPLLSKSIYEWHENPALSEHGLLEGEPYCLPINWFD
jgi:hypothetical protein